MRIIHREFLPSQTMSVHASTIEIWNEHPVFAWFGGMREGAPDTSIYVYNLNGEKETLKLGNKDTIPRWNPILVNLGKNIILFEKVGIFCDRWQTFIHDITNWDTNVTSKEIRLKQKILPAGLNGPVKSRPFIKDDKMYCGSSVETIYDWTSYIEEYTIYRDKGLIFDGRSQPLTEPRKVVFSNPRSGKTERSLGIIQPTIWEEPNGNLAAFFRSSRGLGSIYYSHTYGENGMWSSPVSTNMANPNSAVDVATCEGDLYLVWNPDVHWRFPLVVSKLKKTHGVGNGGGVGFVTVETLTIRDDLNDQNFMDKGCNTPELSYPYMIEHNGQLHISYTYGRSKIEYCIISLDD
jgi:predicted neuraminidase